MSPASGWHRLAEAVQAAVEHAAQQTGLDGAGLVAAPAGAAPPSPPHRPVLPGIVPLTGDTVQTTAPSTTGAGGRTAPPTAESGGGERRDVQVDGDGGGPPDVVRDLVARAQAGDAQAFGELYDRYVDLVFRFVRYRVASHQLAEDITSETFVRALRRISSFTWQGRDIGAWFLTIARNLVTDHYKSGRTRLELTTDDVATAGTVPVLEGPEDQVLDGLRDRQLLEAVRQLGQEQQECIVLRFLQGLSVAETAEVMGKNDGAVKALQYRAVRALARTLPDGLER